MRGDFECPIGRFRRQVTVSREVFNSYRCNEVDSKSPEVSVDYLLRKLLEHVRGGHFHTEELLEAVAIIGEESETKVDVELYSLCKRNKYLVSPSICLVGSFHRRGDRL